MIKDLTWENYLEINDYIKSNNFKHDFFSTIQFIQWQYYGLIFKFRIIENVIIFYVKIKEQNWKLSYSFYNENFDVNETKKIIKDDLIKLNGSDNISIFNFSQEAINDWQLNQYEKEQSQIVSNYIYELESFKTFTGKKMVKKRNHLNYFLSQNHNVNIINIKDVDTNDIIKFTEDLFIKNETEINQSEINDYKELLNQMKIDNRYSGICCYIDNIMVGYTLGFLNNEVYEIAIEKARKDIRGLYQYIIKTNLNFNNINGKYVDREDDLGDVNLAKSKDSYHPIFKIFRYHIKNIKW